MTIVTTLLTGVAAPGESVGRFVIVRQRSKILRHVCASLMLITHGGPAPHPQVTTSGANQTACSALTPGGAERCCVVNPPSRSGGQEPGLNPPESNGVARIRDLVASFPRADWPFLAAAPADEETLQDCGLAPRARVAHVSVAILHSGSLPAVVRDCGWREASLPWRDARSRPRGSSVQTARCLAACESCFAAPYPA